MIQVMISSTNCQLSFHLYMIQDMIRADIVVGFPLNHCSVSLSCSFIVQQDVQKVDIDHLRKGRPTAARSERSDLAEPGYGSRYGCICRNFSHFTCFYGALASKSWTDRHIYFLTKQID